MSAPAVAAPMASTAATTATTSTATAFGSGEIEGGYTCRAYGNSEKELTA